MTEKGIFEFPEGSMLTLPNCQLELDNPIWGRFHSVVYAGQPVIRKGWYIEIRDESPAFRGIWMVVSTCEFYQTLERRAYNECKLVRLDNLEAMEMMANYRQVLTNQNRKGILTS